MTRTNLDLIDQFFAAYGARDTDALHAVVAQDITWVFPGRNPFRGTHRGIDAVVKFFDAMGSAMSQWSPQIEKLITAANETYVVEGQHIILKKPGGSALDHHWCVLWRFENGKIAGGQHLASDQYAVDEFFNAVAS